MTGGEYPVYDFLAASRVERPLAAAFKEWVKRYAKVFADRWSEFAPTKVQLVPSPVSAMSFEAAQARWTQPTVGAPLTLREGAVSGMLVAARTEVIVVVMEILQESLPERPRDRELTTIERSMCQLLFQQVASTFSEAWPDKEPMPVRVGELDHQPQRSRLYPPQKEVLVAGFSIHTAGGAAVGPARFEWLFAKEELKQLLGVRPETATRSSDATTLSPDCLRPLRVEIAAHLGIAELSMNELMQLEEGDIIRFNQSIEQPLTLFVDDRPVLKGWPGRSDKRLCVMVEAPAP